MSSVRPREPIHVIGIGAMVSSVTWVADTSAFENSLAEANSNRAILPNVSIQVIYPGTICEQDMYNVQAGCTRYAHGATFTPPTASTDASELVNAATSLTRIKGKYRLAGMVGPTDSSETITVPAIKMSPLILRG